MKSREQPRKGLGDKWKAKAPGSTLTWIFIYTWGKSNMISLARENYIRNKCSEKMDYLFN